MTKLWLVAGVGISFSVLFGMKNNNPKNNKPSQFYSPNIKPQPNTFKNVTSTNLIRCNSCGATFMSNNYHSCPSDKRYWKK